MAPGPCRAFRSVGQPRRYWRFCPFSLPAVACWSVLVFGRHQPEVNIAGDIGVRGVTGFQVTQQDIRRQLRMPARILVNGQC